MLSLAFGNRTPRPVRSRTRSWRSVALIIQKRRGMLMGRMNRSTRLNCRRARTRRSRFAFYVWPISIMEPSIALAATSAPCSAKSDRFSSRSTYCGRRGIAKSPHLHYESLETITHLNGSPTHEDYGNNLIDPIDDTSPISKFISALGICGSCSLPGSRDAFHRCLLRYPQYACVASATLPHAQQSALHGWAYAHHSKGFIA